MRINENYIESIYGQSTFPVPDMIRLSDSELKELEDRLGVSLSAQLNVLEYAVSRFIQAAPFVHIIPQKNDVAQFANSVSASARELTELLTMPEENHSVKFHVLNMIYHCLHAPEDGLTLRTVLENLSSISSVSGDMARDFKSEPVPAGRPADYVFRRYLQQLRNAARLAKARVTLPSNQDRDIRRSTPFLAFLRSAIETAANKGLVATVNLPLTPDERNKVESSLRSYVKYTDRQIIDGLRRRRSKKCA